MRTGLRFITFFLGLQFGFAQVTSVVEKYALDNTIVSQSSGVIYYNNKIITHNDGGGANALYEMDPTSSVVTRTVTISNASNVDWEDITQDDNYIYIGDIGNNYGNRKDLKIYKISKADYDASNSVSAETINFSYANQTNFIWNLDTTPWDAQSLISIDANNLLIISKNWDTYVAQAYLVPKTPGTFDLSALSSTLYDTSYPNDLINGGTYNPVTNKVVLIGYTWNTSTFDVLQPFIYECSGFTGNDVFSGNNNRYDISSSFPREQTEAIDFRDENTYYVTSEYYSETYMGFTASNDGKLIEITTSDSALALNDVDAEAISLYPNPTAEMVHINMPETAQVEVYNMQAQRLIHTNRDNVDLTAFRPGMYLFKITTADKRTLIKKVLKY
ncbi:T9SS type A sorting domain-containing protein [Gaetbulibacter aquiaggeris]|uniref:T9SS type A sorting domain-containing protein n=1 Tax=Gaetbulibacter aquiaggeris TaxID=1735373 RepID=A0ABW7MKF3_9FLAO